MNSLLYDSLDPEQKFNLDGREKTDFEAYIPSVVKKIEDLMTLLEKIDERSLHKNPEILRQISSLLSLPIPVAGSEEQGVADKFKENNNLAKYHAKLVQTQLLLSEKLSASIKLAK